MTQHDAVDEDFDWEDERDHWQEYKDDLAMGLIDEHGNQLDPREPNCFNCWDTYADPWGRCPDCRPGPLRRAWWWLTEPITRWRHERRMRRRLANIDPNEPPF